MTSPSSLVVLIASLRAALSTIQAPWNPVTVHSARADVMGVADEKFGLLASVTSPTVALAMVAAVNALVPEDRGGSGLLEQVERLRVQAQLLAKYRDKRGEARDEALEEAVACIRVLSRLSLRRAIAAIRALKGAK